jgi:hypothetical protein
MPYTAVTPVYSRLRLPLFHIQTVSKHLSLPFDHIRPLISRLRLAVFYEQPLNIAFHLPIMQQTTVSFSVPVAHAANSSIVLLFAHEMSATSRLKIPYLVTDIDPVFTHLRMPLHHAINRSLKLLMLAERPAHTRISLPFSVLNIDPVFTHLRIPLQHAINSHLKLTVLHEKPANSRLKIPFCKADPVNTQLHIPFLIRIDDPVNFSFKMPFFGTVPPISIVTDDNYLLHKNRRVELLDYAIGQDWDTWLWTGDISPAKPSDYQPMQPGDECTLMLQGQAYALRIASKQHSRSGNDAGTSFRVSLESPTTVLSRAYFNKTWQGLNAKSIAEELCLAFNIG